MKIADMINGKTKKQLEGVASKKATKKDLSTYELEELMGVRRSTYTRSKGRMKQK